MTRRYSLSPSALESKLVRSAPSPRDCETFVPWDLLTSPDIISQSPKPEAGQFRARRRPSPKTSSQILVRVSAQTVGRTGNHPLCFSPWSGSFVEWLKKLVRKALGGFEPARQGQGAGI